MVNYILIYIILIKIKIICKINITKGIQNLKQNLIIGAVINYNWKKVAPFVKSYAMSGFENCECILFVSNMSKHTINKIKAFGIIVYNIPEKYKNKIIINLRWKLYEDFLISNFNKYNLVMAVDVRDIFFQKDPFKYYINKKSFLGVALEDGTLSERINKRWLIRAYGKDLQRKIQHQRIICVGTVWGTIDKLIEFSKEMWKILDSKWSKKSKVIEQAVTNYIIYHNKMFNDSLVKSCNKDGPIMTIGLTSNKNIYFDLNDNIINMSGKIAAVIHQYDRKPNIVRKIMNKYCPEIFDNKTKYYYLLFYFLIAIIFILIKFILLILFKNSLKKKNFEK